MHIWKIFPASINVVVTVVEAIAFREITMIPVISLSLLCFGSHVTNFHTNTHTDLLWCFALPSVQPLFKYLHNDVVAVFLGFFYVSVLVIIGIKVLRSTLCC